MDMFNENVFIAFFLSMLRQTFAMVRTRRNTAIAWLLFLATRNKLEQTNCHMWLLPLQVHQLKGPARFATASSVEEPLSGLALFRALTTKSVQVTGLLKLVIDYCSVTLQSVLVASPPNYMSKFQTKPKRHELHHYHSHGPCSANFEN